MYLVTIQTSCESVNLTSKLIKKHLLLKEFERDLSHNSLEDPTGLLVQLQDLTPRFGQGRLIWRQIGLEDAAE